MEGFTDTASLVSTFDYAARNLADLSLVYETMKFICKICIVKHGSCSSSKDVFFCFLSVSVSVC